jgi:hypothetical protein
MMRAVDSPRGLLNSHEWLDQFFILDTPSAGRIPKTCPTPLKKNTMLMIVRRVVGVIVFPLELPGDLCVWHQALGHIDLFWMNLEQAEQVIGFFWNHLCDERVVLPETLLSLYR